MEGGGYAFQPALTIASLNVAVIRGGTWCLDSPLICAAFGPQIAADLRESADRTLRKSAVNSFCSRPIFDCTRRAIVTNVLLIAL